MVPSNRQAHSRSPAFIKDLLTIAAAGIVALAARSSLASHYYVPSGSMLPTLQEGDRIAVDMLAFSLRVPFTHQSVLRTGAPRRGDVIVLDPPDKGNLLVKRLVALPGDHVEVAAGLLSINGRAIPVRRGPDALYERLDSGEHEIRADDDGGPDFGPTTLGPDCYLVMGDNRGNSRDGRTFGCVKRELILGKVVGVFARDGRPTWRGL
jgi:signal peptidase I